MKTLIESMALEPSDTSRRKRVESTIEQYISDRDDGDMEQAARFATLFDGLLIGMGGEVQDRAREMAQKKAMSASAGSDVNGGGDNGEEAAPRKKSEEEKMLWAFIDMMVQSKSLIKKAMG